MSVSVAPSALTGRLPTVRFGRQQSTVRVAVVDDFRPSHDWSHGQMVRAVLQQKAAERGIALEVDEYPVDHRGGHYRIGEALAKLEAAVNDQKKTYHAINLSMADSIPVNELAALTGHAGDIHTLKRHQGDVFQKTVAAAEAKGEGQLSSWEKAPAKELAAGMQAMHRLRNVHGIPVFVAYPNKLDAVNLYSLVPNVATVGMAHEKQADPAHNNPFITHWESGTQWARSGDQQRSIGPGPSFATPAALMNQVTAAVQA